jgi:anti-sigma B factor antagonist
VSYLPPTFDLTVENIDDQTAVVAVRGEIHLATAPQFSEALTAVLADGRSRVVVDLTAVGFVDSTGLSVLLNALRRTTRAHGALVIACSNPTVLRLFQVTHLDSTFVIVDTRDQALEQARSA